MEPTYELYPFEIAGISAEEPPAEDKTCPGLQRFCPHYAQRVCDVKYRECVLFNSVKTSETMLRMERELLLENPTPQHLEFITQINDVLREPPVETTINPAALRQAQRKGRLTAAVFFAIILAAALLIYLG